MVEYMVNWWEKRCLLTPDHIAVVDGETGERLTYKELNVRVKRLAIRLQAQGIRKGDRLALLAPNHVAYLEWLFACRLLGAVLVPLNWRLASLELASILADCTPKLMGVHSRFATLSAELQASHAMTVVSLDDSETMQIDTDVDKDAAVDPEDPYVMIYTGGTTGKPKGVVLSHRSIFWNAANTVVTWNLTASDVTPTFMPMFHTGGLNALSLPVLHAGGTVVVVQHFDAEHTLELLNREKCTIALLVPTMYHMLIQSPAFAEAVFPTMHTFLSGGAPCPLPVYQAFEAKGLSFKEGYGLTEAGPNNFYIAPHDAVLKRGSVGRPMLYNDVLLADDDGSEVSIGEVGEIWLRGGHMFHSYWNRPEATLEVFSSNGWLKTGDLGKRDTDGFYYIIGRKKDMIISGGENVYPLEVEHQLRQHPAVSDAAVVGVPDEKWGEAVSAAVVLTAGCSVTKEELIKYCSASIGRYKVPKRILFMVELPKTAVGKIDKSRLIGDMVQYGNEA
ncbi:long-chain fatty acid--CoA ligase [Paenibacillus frigoriresistens]|uniref:acyl-CoA synthetase n=1 Tax=Paenibacillus alginolyticus TaxID=59839 RepID=UPI00156628A9|nr:long-chain fatty acid--CoA ligase [Paenibacillus frigoriresistens]NRF90971.1 long-chain fatty acid--CoA ligase [Paenibacillus frigoriresistens]